MSQSFQERFKNRISQIDKNGKLEISTSHSISKPNQSQIFRNQNPLLALHEPTNPLRQSLNIPPLHDPIQKPRMTKPADPFLRKQAQSAQPFRAIKEEHKEQRGFLRLATVAEYKPYTLKDYQAIKPEKYYELGGLGPLSIGTEDWKLKNQIVQRRNQYVKLVNNASLPLSCLRKPIKAKLIKSDRWNVGKIAEIPSISNVLEEIGRKQ